MTQKVLSQSRNHTTFDVISKSAFLSGVKTIDDPENSDLVLIKKENDKAFRILFNIYQKLIPKKKYLDIIFRAASLRS